MKYDIIKPMEKIDPITKRIQRINLETYKHFSKLCKDNDLRYFAISGTSIGVHFWNGFIPWDDDMDIAMPFEDFEKFRKIFYKQLPKDYAFIELPELGGKIYNKHTTLIEAPYAFLPNHYYGAFIDIVPLIGLPNNEAEREKFVSDVKRYIIEAGTINKAPELSTFTGQTPQKIQRLRRLLTTQYPFGTTKYCTDFSCIKCPLYLTEGFLKPAESPFEDTVIPISSKQEHDLKAAYGTLVKNIPPSERQLVHHNFYAYCNLNTPCAKYTKAYLDIKTPTWFKDITYKDHLFGISSAREAGLYKILCRSLEEQLAKEKQAHLDEVNVIRTSASYRLGNRLLKPISKLKAMFNKKH